MFQGFFNYLVSWWTSCTISNWNWLESLSSGSHTVPTVSEDWNPIARRLGKAQNGFQSNWGVSSGPSLCGPLKGRKLGTEDPGWQRYPVKGLVSRVSHHHVSGDVHHDFHVRGAKQYIITDNDVFFFFNGIVRCLTSLHLDKILVALWIRLQNIRTLEYQYIRQQNESRLNAALVSQVIV